MAIVDETNLEDPRDLSKGVIVVLSGGPVDIKNPADVLQSMDHLIQDVNADPLVQANTGGKGLTVKLPNWNFHIHQSEWPTICNVLKVQNASPLILVGHSNGGRR